MTKDPFLNLLHLLPPELAHDLSLKGLSLNRGKIPWKIHPSLPSLTLSKNIRWLNPFGLAAGFDKNGVATCSLSQMGFGSLELGTLTLKPQVGNSKPRIFRISSQHSLRNSMGFPNVGISSFLNQWTPADCRLPFGINLGPNKNFTPSSAHEDLIEVLSQVKKISPHWITLNISSPNTPGLRGLDLNWLQELLVEWKKLYPLEKIFLKISPDINVDTIHRYHELCSTNHLAGIIATNTTFQPQWGTGGISGQLLKVKAQNVWKTLLGFKPSYIVIAVGGFSHFNDWLDLWFRGGKAAQFYTAFIYQGFSLLKSLNLHYLGFFQVQGLNPDDFFNLELKERQERIIFFKNTIGLV